MSIPQNAAVSVTGSIPKRGPLSFRKRGRVSELEPESVTEPGPELERVSVTEPELERVSVTEPELERVSVTEPELEGVSVTESELEPATEPEPVSVPLMAKLNKTKKVSILIFVYLCIFLRHLCNLCKILSSAFMILVFNP